MHWKNYQIRLAPSTGTILTTAAATPQAFTKLDVQNLLVTETKKKKKKK